MDVRVYIAYFLVSFLAAVIVTPLIIRLSYRFRLVDRPNERKVHTREVPRIGGIAIVSGVLAGLVIFRFSFPGLTGIAFGSLVIIITGIIDDIYTLSPIHKLMGQIVAAVIPISFGITISKFMLPFYGEINLDIMSYVITFLWIIIVTNSINLIDGLDGLAVGVSTIALTIMLFFAVSQQQYFLIGYIVLLIGSNIGFFVYNFHPAKIFMGDVGSLFLGYTISLLSIVGFFKGIALTSVLLPVIILAIPLSDTFFAIVRRMLSKQNIMKPDKSHLHHCLLRLGYSHRTTVLILYGAAVLFGTFAFFFPYYNYRVAIVLFLIFLFFIEIIAEVIGLTGGRGNPILHLLRKLGIL
ncbi:MraY family glycosyltransferase [Ectobacillus panaciterrae]|uniref:glycosyltransferase family 4 protein n=1 Tax=Ectobacillus panaciterrae TaxID=363872 RepID=UPI000424FE2C